uniref:WW domain-containing protein n=1 Tax=Lotharella oceanica TaxID=641309 RepID=A0A7S2TR48_9EUKA|mmetsp:Transcript_26180/g.48810  ORF Transcript_26180/g.48810 Transcript_26180/m.48810 type:complete len:273 (+) Transcript_26180:49-867(+)
MALRSPSGLILLALLPFAQAGNGNNHDLAAAVLCPIFFIGFPPLAVLILFRELPHQMLLGQTGGMWLSALVAFSCAGHSLSVEVEGDYKPFYTTEGKFVTASGVLSWLYISLFLLALFFKMRERFRQSAKLIVLVLECIFVLFAFAASCAGFQHWNGKDGYCTKDGSKERYCETWKASVAFTWILFWGFATRLYFALTHYREAPPEAAEQLVDEAPEQDYDVLEDERGNANALAPAPAVAPKWQEFIDDTTGAPYWHNAETGVSTWTKPEGI